MPERKKSSSNGSFSVSYKTIGAIAALLTVLGFLWTAIGKVATKDDVKELAVAYTTNYTSLEGRVRNIELQLAAFFGKNASASFVKPLLPGVEYTGGARLISVQEPSTPNIQDAQRVYAQRYMAVRKVVVTKEFIVSHNLTPSKGGSYGVLGEDGNFYALDDVLAILVQEHQDIMHPERKKK